MKTKRVGLLVPSSNTVMEVDFHRRLPPDASLHTGRMFMEETTPQAEAEMLDRHALPAARAVASARPHVIVFGCTSAGALRGNAYDAEFCGRLAHETGTPVVSVIKAVREAVAKRNGRRLGVVTPYIDELNEKIKESLEQDGELEVVTIAGLGITENFAIAEVTPDDIVEFARRSVASEPIDLLFVSCTNFRAFDAVDRLGDQLEVPVVTSNLAALEAASQQLDIHPEVSVEEPGR
jgi:maleate isomerase